MQPTVSHVLAVVEMEMKGYPVGISEEKPRRPPSPKRRQGLEGYVRGSPYYEGRGRGAWVDYKLQINECERVKRRRDSSAKPPALADHS